MARPLRIEFPGAVYHVTSRGDRRETQLGAPVGLGLGEAIDDLVAGELLEALQREGRARSIA